MYFWHLLLCCASFLRWYFLPNQVDKVSVHLVVKTNSELFPISGRMEDNRVFDKSVLPVVFAMFAYSFLLIQS
jgi:hypothetical protein